MVENQRIFSFLAHLTLLLGVVIVALPIYVTFIASTQAPEDVLSAPIPMTPGDRLVENYGAVLGQGLERRARPADDLRTGSGRSGHVPGVGQ